MALVAGPEGQPQAGQLKKVLQPEDRNRVNRESLANALCNDNSIVKLEQLQAQAERKSKPVDRSTKQDSGGGDASSAGGGMSSPFVTRNRD